MKIFVFCLITTESSKSLLAGQKDMHILQQFETKTLLLSLVLSHTPDYWTSQGTSETPVPWD